MRSFKMNPAFRNCAVKPRRFLARIVVPLLLIACPGLGNAQLQGFAFTDTIDPDIRPFEVDLDFFKGGSRDGMVGVCAQGLHGSTQFIKTYHGNLGGAFTGTVVAAGGQYFSSSCFTVGDALYGTFIDASANRSVVFFRTDPYGGVFSEAYYGGGFNSVDSGIVKVDGRDIIAAIGVNRSTLQTVLITAPLELGNPTAVLTDTIPVGNPFEGFMVTKVTGLGGDGILYSLGQTPGYDVILKQWEFGAGGVTLTNQLLDPTILSTGFPNEAGLDYDGQIRVACYFDDQNPTVSVMDNNFIISNTTLPLGGNHNFDIDCRLGTDGNVNVWVSDKYYLVDPTTQQLLETHPYTVTIDDGQYLPVGGIAEPLKGLMTAGSLVFGLGFAGPQMPVEARPVPTLNDWMLIALAVFLLGSAGWIARRQMLD